MVRKKLKIVFKTYGNIDIIILTCKCMYIKFRKGKDVSVSDIKLDYVILEGTHYICMYR